jgi:hypothetical protein
VIRVVRKRGEVHKRYNAFWGVLMPKCPKCGEEIDHLHYYAYELQKADFDVFDNGDFEYNSWDSLCDVKGEPEYCCPECSATLFRSQDEAIKFLKPQTPT